MAGCFFPVRIGDILHIAFKSPQETSDLSLRMILHSMEFITSSASRWRTSINMKKSFRCKFSNLKNLPTHVSQSSRILLVCYPTSLLDVILQTYISIRQLSDSRLGEPDLRSLEITPKSCSATRFSP